MGRHILKSLFSCRCWALVVFFICFSYVQAGEEAYKVTVHADSSEAKDILTKYLDLVTQRFLEDIDQEQIDALVEDTPESAKKLLETLGYFDSQVTVQPVEGGYDIVVKEGEPVKVDDVAVLLQGPILQDDDLGARYRNVMMGWSLPIGSVFKQGKWSDSKTSVLRSVTVLKYPLAKISYSKAAVDPEKKSAILEVNVDSHQEIRFGDIEVSGTQRYPQTIIKNMADFKYGSYYDLNKILDYQGALEQDGHFSNVVVTALFDQIQDDHVPIKVELVEVPKKKLDLGLKYDSEEGFGTNFGYTHYNVFNRGLTGSVLANVTKEEQKFGLDLNIPRGNNGYYHLLSTHFKNSEVQKVKTKSGNISFWRARKHGNIESKVGIEYLLESSKIVNGPKLGDTHVVLGSFNWTQRRTDSALRPRNGRLLDLVLSVTPGSLASSTSLIKADARVAFYYTPENINLGTWLVRGQLGHIQAKNDSKVPTSILFRTGGANSIRGYEYQSIGIAGPNDSVLGGTTVAVASLEYQYPVTENVSLALFHDMGDVSMKMKDLKLKHSNGLGVRWFSPVAPLSVDFAQAQEDHKWRWHMSLGLVF